MMMMMMMTTMFVTGSSGYWKRGRTESWEQDGGSPWLHSLCRWWTGSQERTGDSSSSSSLSSSSISEIWKSETLEHICLEVFCQKKRILINNFYRPPNGDKVTFLENLSLTLEAIKQNKGWITCCLGDVNFGNLYCFFNSLNVKPIDQQGCQIFEDYQFTNLIDRPTRYTNHSVSLIDLFFVDRFDKVSAACVWSNIADHNGISASFDLCSKRPKQRTFEKYEFNQMTNDNWISFKSHLDDFSIKSRNFVSWPALWIFD